MKDINFIKTLSVKEQHGLRKWATFSLSMLGLVIIAIAFLQIPQLNTFNKTKKEQVQLAQNIDTTNIRITENKTLQNKMCCLGDQCKQIDILKCSTQTPRSCIQCITNACTNGITLQACNLQSNHLAITAQCNTVQQATHFLQKLRSDNHFSKIELTSLQPAPGNLVTFEIKGTINS